jgi:hypothetical protein
MIHDIPTCVYVGSGYDLKIRYSNITDSTPNAREIAAKELDFLEPNRKIVPGSGDLATFSKERFQENKLRGQKLKGKVRGKGKGGYQGRMKKLSGRGGKSVII